MSVSEKPRAIGKPRLDNLPFDVLAVEFFRLGDGASLSGFNQLDVYPLRVCVGQVLAIGRNRPARHGVLGGIGGELPQLQFRWRIFGSGGAFGEPESPARDQ